MGKLLTGYSGGELAWLTSFETCVDPECRVRVISSIDSDYYCYAEALIKSAELFSGGCDFHINIVNPTASVLKSVKLLSERLVSVRLAVSTQQVDFGDASNEEKITYYACSRYLLMSEIVVDDPGRVLLLDADSLIVGDLKDLELSATSSVTMICRLDNSKEYLRVAGGTIYTECDEHSVIYFKRVAAIIARSMRDKKSAWYLDQIALYRAYLDTGINLSNINAAYSDWEFSPDSKIWAAKGNRKSTDYRYVSVVQLLSACCCRFSIKTYLYRLIMILAIRGGVTRNISFYRRYDQIFRRLGVEITSAEEQHHAC